MTEGNAGCSRGVLTSVLVDLDSQDADDAVDVGADQGQAAVKGAGARRTASGWRSTSHCCAIRAEQIEVPFPSLARYGSRGATRSNHRRLAVRHLGLRAFVPAHDMRTAMDLAARAAFDTDDGRIILARLSGEIKPQRFVLPSADTLERIGLAGRARARRLSAQALNDALGDERKKAKITSSRSDYSVDSMARPRLDEKERRARTVGVRVTAAEAARRARRPPALFIQLRSTVSARAPLPSPPENRPGIVSKQQDNHYKPQTTNDKAS